MAQFNNVIGLEVKRRLEDISDIKKESEESVKRSLEAKENADEAKHRSDITKKQLEEAIKNGDQVVEVQTLRVDPLTGETYATAADRFEANQRKVAIKLEENDKNIKDLGYNLAWNALLALDGDWSNAIQTAINTVKETGQAIFVPANVFEYSQTLQMYNFVSFKGQSPKESKLKYVGTDKAFNFIDPDNELREHGKGCNYNSFTDLSLIGPGKDVITSSGIYGEPRYLNTYNFHISDFGTLLDIKGAWTNKFTKSHLFRANTWIRAKGQNNANVFDDCFFFDSTIGFEMETSYGFYISKSNIEGCTDVLLRPTHHSGCRWSNFKIENTYLENDAKLLDTDYLAGNGETLTDWNIFNFAMESCNTNYFLNDSFIYQRISVLYGYIKDTHFYKLSDTELFDMSSSALVFEDNYYYYFDDVGHKIPLSSPFSDYMVKENSNYISISKGYPNAQTYSGSIKANRGFIVGSEWNENAAGEQGHLYYQPDFHFLRVGHGGSSSNYSWLQPVLAVASENRPKNLNSGHAGLMVFDTTLQKPIWWSGESWKDANGSYV